MASQTTENGKEEFDDGVSMVDVLKGEEQLDEDAAAVLGAGDPKNCTYEQGYADRQPLYACKTCMSEGDAKPAGVCLACSLECHDKHDLVELYTKRNFRCDCGNKKFPELTCKLQPEREDTNSANQYNQNFKGLYCICNRPYPDSDNDEDDCMIQCVVCEDWYHSRHLGCELPKENSYDEMICKECTERASFLRNYPKLCVNADGKSECDETETVDVISTDAGTSDASGIRDVEKCLISNAGDVSKQKGSTFWTESWRNKLCQCSKCKIIYDSLNLAFLFKEGDPISVYEEKGKNRKMSRYETGLQALSSIDRIQQVEVLHEYNDMKSELTDFLKTFADNKKVVRKEDIEEFFEGMHAKKKQKMSNTNQYYCK